MSSIDTTLTERGTRYGQFDEHARITQNIKSAMQDSPNWSRLSPDQKEAMEMAAHKFGRILNGDPDYIDSWHDVIGYTRLVEQRLEKASRQKAFDFGPEQVQDQAQDKPKSDPKVACGCPACEIRRKLESIFGPGVEVKILSEESGEAD